jgi:hypothetical protein
MLQLLLQVPCVPLPQLCRAQPTQVTREAVRLSAASASTSIMVICTHAVCCQQLCSNPSMLTICTYMICIDAATADMTIRHQVALKALCQPLAHAHSTPTQDGVPAAGWLQATAMVVWWCGMCSPQRSCCACRTSRLQETCCETTQHQQADQTETAAAAGQLAAVLGPAAAASRVWRG